MECLFKESHQQSPTWQFEHLRQGEAVVPSRGDDALRPGPLGSQLVQPLAGGQAVLADGHPVVRGRGDQDAQPANKADEKAAQLETRVCHGAHSA